jgi:DNA processing protein
LNKSHEIYKIACSNLFGIGPVRAAQIISKIGSADELFINSIKTIWQETGISKSLLKAMKREEALELAENQYNYNLKHDIDSHFFLDKNYPRRLKQCGDPPIIIYSKGKMDLNQNKIVSIVGTRNLTNYGSKILHELIESLKNEQIQVISGLAYGVDILAHRLCVEHGLETIGVLGHGLDRIYPFKHRSTALEMMENGGLITEFMINTNPDRENFPMRNRIVAGMADATIVIESEIKGGSIITAELANDYSRDVFAYPGDVDRPFSEGCNDLIRKQKAHLITRGDDFLTFMNWKESNKKQVQQKQLFHDLNQEEERIVYLLESESELHTDVLCMKSGITPSQMNVHLFNLEMANVIQQLPGKRFKLVYQ